MDKKARIAMISALLLLGFLIIGIAMAKAPPQCRDGIDNDGDTKTDYPNDPGCLRRNDNSELNPNVECDDGIDNDGDGAVDLSDAGCSSSTDNDETNCGDGVCEGFETQSSCPADCGTGNLTLI